MVKSGALATTVIGSFPKPAYLSMPDWFKDETGDASKKYTDMLANQSSEDKENLEANFMRATKELCKIQSDCGINVVTDGEVRRENYIHYLCRFIGGIDFDNLTETVIRNGAMKACLPTIREKISWQGLLDVAGEWRKAQDVSPVPVKYTLPGPMTIMGTTHNAFYQDEPALAADLAVVVNRLVLELVTAGCPHVQIDEPLFARQPQKALDWGIQMLDRCFEGVGDKCEKTVHICCGYPEYLDQEGYLKADPNTYFQLAKSIDASCVDAVSIEDAHCKNDLSLLENFKNTKVILGVFEVASSRIESQDEIETRLKEALKHIDADRLIVAPDCGLGLLPLPVLEKKLSNMCAAAKSCMCGAGAKRRKLNEDE